MGFDWLIVIYLLFSLVVCVLVEGCGMVGRWLLLTCCLCLFAYITFGLRVLVVCLWMVVSVYGLGYAVGGVLLVLTAFACCFCVLELFFFVSGLVAGCVFLLWTLL